MAGRRADFAGSWYPGEPSDCRRVIEEFSSAGLPCPSSSKAGVGGIVPHAGWFFSGRIACNVIKCLTHQKAPETVVIFGRHLHPSSGNYIMKKGSWRTPLGELEIDEELGERIADEFSFSIETESLYEQDNTIELQLPFIKFFLPDAKILPMGVPPRLDSLKIGERVAELSEVLGRSILILGSTDLTHYGYNYGYTPKGVGEKAVKWVKEDNDKKIIDLMVAMDAEGVINESLMSSNACCSGAAAAAIAASKRLGAQKGDTLIYATSYDIRPDNSFVGYVGMLFH